MKKNLLKRLTSLTLALVLLCGVFAGGALAAEPEVISGGATAPYNAEWTNDALSATMMRSLINAETLYPQTTGWDKLDDRLEKVLSAGGSTAFDQLWSFYDWIVKNVTIDDWEGYSVTYPSLAAYNSVDGYDYLAPQNFDTSHEEVVPDDMVNRAYHLLLMKKGLSYDCAIAFALAARHVGIEAYVHTGYFTLESSGKGHHGWAVLVIGGNNYIFDPQRDAVNYKENGRTGFYFGIPYSKSDRYEGDYTANKERDASMTPVAKNYATLRVNVDGEGTVSGAGIYKIGSTVTLTAAPKEGYGLQGFYDRTGKLMTYKTSYSFTLRGNTTITAKFGPAVTIGVEASASGTATGGGTYAVGVPVTIKASSDTAAFSGWYTGGGSLVSDKAEFTFVAAGSTTYYAMFQGDMFRDVTAGSYYADAVKWAVQQGITQGTSDTTFSPDDSCTRAQIVTFLWRDAGEPEPSTVINPFTDVAADAYYYKAVLWAVQQGITQGTSNTTFSPDDTCTRAQAVTFLWRANGQTAAEGANPFTDVPADAYYANAVVWAVANGITQGTTDTTFSPDAICTRAQIVTFLYRAPRPAVEAASNTAQTVAQALPEPVELDVELEPEIPQEPALDE